MIPVKVEGVRRNFTVDSPLMYSVSLIDEAGQRLLVFSIERHEALPVVAALNNWTLPRPGPSISWPRRSNCSTILWKR